MINIHLHDPVAQFQVPGRKQIRRRLASDAFSEGLRLFVYFPGCAARVNAFHEATGAV
jgi:hypothetical protein